MQYSYPDYFYLIALIEVKGIGTVTAKKLIDQYGSAYAVFHQSRETYLQIGNLGKSLLEALEKEIVFTIAKEQIEYCSSNNIEILSYYNSNYPQRLKQNEDAPLILYFKGRSNLNAPKMISIVGTRNATSYGKNICRNIVEELAKYDCTIISGLAYGIDVAAHKNAIDFETPTVGVLAQGINTVYPIEHKPIAEKMMNNGGLLTEYKINTRPNRENFPKRNRIVAGMCDAIIVIESTLTGGSMITTKLGKKYYKDIFAVPGRMGDVYSEGCNHLIKTKQAYLLQHTEDVPKALCWTKQTQKNPQPQLFIELTPEETVIVDALEKQSLTIDELAIVTESTMSVLSAQLLLLEFKGAVKQLPGKRYELVI